MKERPGFMLYFDMVDALSAMADSDAGQLFKALMAYARYGEVQELTGMAAFAFELVRGRIDRDGETYREKCRKSAYAAYSGAARRRGEIPVEYEEWDGASACGRMPNTTTTAATATTPTPAPAAMANTNRSENQKTNTDIFSKTNNRNAIPPLNDDVSWVGEFLEERKRQGGAGCRKHTES